MKRLFATRRARAAVVAAAAAGLLLPAAAAIAAFNGSVQTGAATIESKALYSETKTWSTYDIGDLSSGTEVFADDTLADDDGFIQSWYYTDDNIPAAFAESTNYFDVIFNAPLQPGLAVTNPEFFLAFATENPFNMALYAKVYRRSTMTLLATSPVISIDGDTTGYLNSTNFDLDSVVTTSDIANDLLVRLFARNDGAAPGDGVMIDAAKFTGTTPYGNFTLNRESVVDRLDGSAVTSPWALLAVDGTMYSPGTSWAVAATYDTTRYARYTFPDVLPTGASTSAVTLHHAFRPATGASNICYFLRVYSRTGTLLASRGSTSSDHSCHTGTSVKTETISLPELLGSDAVDGMEVRFYWRTASGTATRSQTDRLAVETTFSLS